MALMEFFICYFQFFLFFVHLIMLSPIQWVYFSFPSQVITSVVKIQNTAVANVKVLHMNHINRGIHNRKLWDGSSFPHMVPAKRIIWNARASIFITRVNATTWSTKTLPCIVCEFCGLQNQYRTTFLKIGYK